MAQESRIFGVPFDPANSPERLDLKTAYVRHLMECPQLSSKFYDPYDVIQAFMNASSSHRYAWIGKMPVDSWLRPRPKINDLPRLTMDDFIAFFENNGCWDYALKVAEFVEAKILPHRPIMIGVDHSSTGGLLLALSRKYDNLNVIILDAHFDVMKYSGFIDRGTGEQPSFYHCGNFLSYLLEKRIVRPENLWMLGISEKALAEDAYQHLDSKSRSNLEEVKLWITKGVRLELKEAAISEAASIKLSGPTYVSLDMDAGSFSSVYSARYMNSGGLSLQEFLHLLNRVALSVRASNVPLAGLDIMEIDIHLLEAAESLPLTDYTKYIAGESLKLFLDGML